MVSWLLLASLVLRCAANFGIPSSNATVDVKAFNVANFSATLPGVLVQPVLPGHETIQLPLHAFLVEHTATGKRFMFDIGTRNDTANLPPSVASLFASGVYSAQPFKPITVLLEEGGIPLNSIETVYLEFPNTTGLVIGPGTNRSLYPEFPDSALQASDFAGRNVTELDFNHTDLTFSGLPALDYFGDGSFYLLNTPGHLVGHMTALARVTPSTFIVLGADTAHHPGQLRPRPKFQHAYPCPTELLEQSKTSVSTDYFWSPDTRTGMFHLPSRAQPLLSIPDLPDSADVNPVAARVSLDKIAEFDAHEDFFVVLAHDESLVPVLPYFPKSLNAWKEIKDQVLWGFLNETNPAYRFGP